jgi:hypothetical protein
MRKTAFKRRLKRLELSMPVEEPPMSPRIVIPPVAGEPLEPSPDMVEQPPARPRLEIPDYDDRYPKGWFA